VRHKQFEEWLQLALYDELNEQEKALLDNHLSSCERCRVELEKMKKFSSVIAQHKPVAVPESILQDARRNLRIRLQNRAADRSLFGRMKDAVDNLLAPQWQVALGGITLLAAGILAGYFIFKSSPERSLLVRQAGLVSPVMQAGESQIANVRFIDRNTQTGDVDFTFETITPVHIRGNVNDEDVQKVLARALVSNQNIGVRLRAVSMIGDQAEQKRTPELDKEIKAALISALLHDPNLGVRKEALQALQHYLPDSAIVRAFLTVLANDKSTALKVAAINLLDLSKYENQPISGDIQSMLKSKVQSDDNNYIRIRAKAALQEVRP
jgi:anti-sigma factor RsiW